MHKQFVTIVWLFFLWLALPVASQPLSVRLLSGKLCQGDTAVFPVVLTQSATLGAISLRLQNSQPSTAEIVQLTALHPALLISSPLYTYLNHEFAFYWADLNGVSFAAGDTLFFFQIVAKNGGTSAFSWDTSVGEYCELADTAGNVLSANFFVNNITIFPLTQPQLWLVGGGVCEGGQALVEATGGNFYEFFVNGVLAQSYSNQSQFVTTIAAGDEVTVRAHQLGYCPQTSLPLNVVFFPQPTQPVVSQIGNFLASTLASTYQWLLNGNLLSGATNQVYIPTQSGFYQVQTTNVQGCAATSDSVFFLHTASHPATTQCPLTVYPNPTANCLQLDCASLPAPLLATLYHPAGNICAEWTISPNFCQPLPPLPQGAYWLLVKDEKGSIWQRTLVFIMQP